ncbi:LytR family transcriptional regulator [Streptomyces sp. SID4948]|nr:LCP family protein [Streptomyces sp. SID4948]MYS21622.1 LytR family transcriptional regulator [Streptomyces sp. SID4948]
MPGAGAEAGAGAEVRPGAEHESEPAPPPTPEAEAEPAPAPTPEPAAAAAAAATTDDESKPTAEAATGAGAAAGGEAGTEPVVDPAVEPVVDPAVGPAAGPAAEGPVEPVSPAEADARPAAGPGREIPPARPRYRWVRVISACTAFLVLALGGGGWYLWQHLNSNITTDTTTENELKAQAAQRPTEGPTKAENILLIGSDNRGDGNEKYGHDTGTQRSDTTILLHLAADRSSATAVSIPRDLMVHVPECTKPDGSTVAPRFEQFNWAFEFGGAACTIRAVENMTGIRVDHHLVVDFSGFKKMVDAVNGVEVCVAEPVHDANAHLDLPAGQQKLNGEQALGYVRARESLGDGSDTQRMERQQDFLASLVKKVRSNGVLLNPVKLYPLLSAATSSLTADPGLDSLNELYNLAHSIQQTPTGAIRFLTLPQEPYVEDHDRDQLRQPGADELFAALRADQPVNVTGEAGPDSSTGTSTSSPTSSPTSPSSGSPSAPAGGTTDAPTNVPASATPSAAPTYKGTTADRDICGNDQ